MREKERKEIVVPKEKAVFWLDEFGRWHNEHGQFEHKKIIAHFHSSIRRDADGYYLFQKYDDHTFEKVYFRYVDTALFVFDVKMRNDSGKIRLILNTKEEFPLDPNSLFVQNENLYTEHDGHRIKFLDRALLKLGDRLRFSQNRYHFEFHGRNYEIPFRS